MSFLSAHRPPPEPPQPNTVAAEPATAEACDADYDQGATTRTNLDRIADRQYGGQR